MTRESIKLMSFIVSAMLRPNMTHAIAYCPKDKTLRGKSTHSLFVDEITFEDNSERSHLNDTVEVNSIAKKTTE